MKNTAQNSTVGFRFTAQVFIRAAIVAIIIGCTLVLINQFDAIFGQSQLQYLPMSLAFITPFVVVSLSQVFGARAAKKLLLQGSSILRLQQGFFQIVLSHGIPLRAIIMGIVAGSVNTAIVATINLSVGKDLDQLPFPLILQALTLPIIFGALSQVLSFRRVIKGGALNDFSHDTFFAAHETTRRAGLAVARSSLAFAATQQNDFQPE